MLAPGVFFEVKNTTHPYFCFKKHLLLRARMTPTLLLLGRARPHAGLMYFSAIADRERIDFFLLRE